jgi:hypothetical protein
MSRLYAEALIAVALFAGAIANASSIAVFFDGIAK